MRTALLLFLRAEGATQGRRARCRLLPDVARDAPRRSWCDLVGYLASTASVSGQGNGPKVRRVLCLAHGGIAHGRSTTSPARPEPRSSRRCARLSVRELRGRVRLRRVRADRWAHLHGRREQLRASLAGSPGGPDRSAPGDHRSPSPMTRKRPGRRGHTGSRSPHARMVPQHQGWY